ncbi:GAF domain-containing protein [Streptomyces sp. NPDC001273]|uniref:GAF domain-containing protein n=1 Tax=unclassified Streptomyces TaxID=2593676 RepID=UPI0033F491FB
MAMPSPLTLLRNVNERLYVLVLNRLLGPRRMKPWGVAILSAVSVGLPTVPAFAADSLGLYYIGTCVLCAFTASFFTLNTSQKKVEADRSVVLEAALEPISRLMGEMLLDPAGFEEKQEKALKRLVETAGELAHADAGSGLYWLSADNTELHLASANEQAMQLHFQDKFVRSVEKGSFLVGAALSVAGRPVSDIRKDPDRDRVYMAEDCRSALFVPVRAGATKQGLLMIQALKPGRIPADFREDKRLKSVVNLIGFVKELKKPSASTGGNVPQQNRPPTGDPEGASS